MKYESTPAFDADVKGLKPGHRAAFREVLLAKSTPACAALANDPAAVWPKWLRVESVHGAPGVLEMTWSFASPDGWATFELVTVDDDLRCRWRRVGDHDVFTDP